MKKIFFYKKIKFKIISSLILFLALFGWTKNSYAAPNIFNVSGTVIHGSEVTIVGSEFGEKNPVLPLWWDDGEGAEVNIHSIMTSGEMPWVISTLTGTNKNYNSALPSTDVVQESQIQYHLSGFRSVSAPHSRSNKYLAGHHSNAYDCVDYSTSAQDVGVTISDRVNRHDVWYMNYYLRLDPNWPIDATREGNYKFITWERGEPYTMYDGHSPGFAYDNLTSCGAYNSNPSCGNNYIYGRFWGLLDQTTCAFQSPTWGSPFITYNTGILNPRIQWTKNEHWMKNGGSHATDVFKWVSDNKTAIDISLDDDCQLNSTAHNYSPGGVTIGGFWRLYLCGGADAFGANAWRYFDDIYVDNTFSRIILSDNQNYDQATIMEPQIPSAWDGNSITTKVNLGKLPDSGIAYLFVFDADDNHNNTGYPVTLGGGSGNNPPSAPTGVKVY